MSVTLTKSALDQLSVVSAFSERDDPKRKIPSLSWHISITAYDTAGNVVKRLGPGFGVSWFYADQKWGDRQYREQDGVEFLLTLPPEAAEMDDILIDYQDRMFVFI